MGAFALQGKKDFLDRVAHHISLNRSAGLPQRLAQCHGRGHRDVERAQARLDRDHQPRVGGGCDLFGDPGGFPPEQQDIIRAVAIIQIGTRALGREQDQPESRVVTPLLEF
jgi:hypothetical protein